MLMNKKEHKPLKCFLKWTHNEPEHPQQTMIEYTWETGIDITMAGTFLKFGADTTLNEWRKSEIEKYVNLRKKFKKDKKILALDFIINGNVEKMKEIESDINFVRWAD